MKKLKTIVLLFAVIIAGACSSIEVNETEKASFKIKIQEIKADNGITAWLMEDHTNPITVMSIAFKVGSSSDPEDKQGLAYMVSGLIDEGADNIKSLAFQDILKNNAIKLSFDAGRNTFTGYLKTLTENQDKAFNLLKLALTKPRFDKEPVERIRGQILASIKQDMENPNEIAFSAWTKKLFPNHPLGRKLNGTYEGVQNVNKKDLKNFVKTRFAKDNLIIGVCGDITPEKLKKVIEDTFGDLPDKAVPVDIKQTRPVLKGQTEVVEMQIPQSIAVFGHEGIDRKDEDFYPAYIMNHILGGGGFSSRLVDEVRKEKGLAYGVSSDLYDMDYANLLIGFVSTNNAKMAESLEIIRKEWQKMYENGPTEKELKDAKNYLTGSFPLRFNSTDTIARILASIQVDELGIDYLDKRNSLVEKVTIEDTRRIAKEILTPDKMETIIVGKPENINPENINKETEK